MACRTQRVRAARVDVAPPKSADLALAHAGHEGHPHSHVRGRRCTLVQERHEPTPLRVVEGVGRVGRQLRRPHRGGRVTFQPLEHDRLVEGTLEQGVCLPHRGRLETACVEGVLPSLDVVRPEVEQHDVAHALPDVLGDGAVCRHGGALDRVRPLQRVHVLVHEGADALVTSPGAVELPGGLRLELVPDLKQLAPRRGLASCLERHGRLLPVPVAVLVLEDAPEGRFGPSYAKAGVVHVRLDSAPNALVRAHQTRWRRCHFEAKSNRFGRLSVSFLAHMTR